MSLKTKIEKIIELSGVAEVERAALIMKHFDDLGMSLGSPEAQAYGQEPTPKMDTLKHQLGDYCEDIVLRIQTIMYAGRDNDSDIAGLHIHLAKNTRDKADAVRTILEKSPRGQYLEKGLRVAQMAGFDLDNDW